MTDDTTKRPDYFAHVAATAAHLAAQKAREEPMALLVEPLPLEVWPLIAAGDLVRLSNGNAHEVVEPPKAYGEQTMIRVGPLPDDPRVALSPSDSLLVPMFQVVGHQSKLGREAIAELRQVPTTEESTSPDEGDDSK